MTNIEVLQTLAPLTQWTQDWIYEWQNPHIEECARKKFLLFSDEGTEDAGHGLGTSSWLSIFDPVLICL